MLLVVEPKSRFLPHSRPENEVRETLTLRHEYLFYISILTSQFPFVFVDTFSKNAKNELESPLSFLCGGDL